MSRLLTVSLAGLLALAPAACSDDVGDCPPGSAFCIEDAPQLEIQPAEEVIAIVDSAMAAGDSVVREIRVINRGTGTLSLRDVGLAYEAPAGAVDDAGPAFELVPLAVALPFGIEPFGGDDFPQGVNVQVRYTKQADDLPRTATLTFGSNDILAAERSIGLTTDIGVPRLSASPMPVDFGLVPRTDERIGKTLSLLNTGSRVLNVSGFRVARDGRFGVRGPGFDLFGPDASLGVDLEEAIAIPPGQSRTVEATFLSDSPSPADGDLLIFSDDPTSGAAGFVVPLVANKSGPCVLVTPRRVDFGGKLVGQLATISVRIDSCGTEPLQLESLTMQAGSSPDFGLDFSALGPGFEGGPTPENPLVVPINESVTVGVTFVPDAVNPRDADNVPIPDQGVLLVASNAFESEVPVEIRGAGADVECPTPVIHIEEGEEVVPLTVLHLDATQSYAPFGTIREFLWQRPRPDAGTAPPGSTSLYIPNSTDPQPVFEVNVVGTYVFRLDVVDESGNVSGTEDCPTAEYTVLVQPDQAILVELTWVTPGDPDETDTGEGLGSDLDLHFAHQNAVGPDLDGDGFPDPWFDQDWDVFWFNGEPNWGSLNPAVDDNPSLDRDDTDGGGPENIRLGIPEDGVTYAIGVHYWNDWGFGPADATVRVFHYADLVYEMTRPAMNRLDMWCVGHIHWPVPAVERCADDEQPEYVTPNYVNQFFRPPGG